MKKNVLVMFLFALFGTLFAGYLTFKKYFSDTCPLTEGCTYLFGYPSCIYGFILFFILLIFSGLLLLKSMEKKSSSLIKAIFYVSLAGVIFAFYSSIKEVFFPNCPLGKCTYTLLVPTCIYGLVFFLVIFAIAVKEKNKAVKAKH